MQRANVISLKDAMRAKDHINRHGHPPTVVALRKVLDRELNYANEMYRQTGGIDQEMIDRIVSIRRQIEQAHLDLALHP